MGNYEDRSKRQQIIYINDKIRCKMSRIIDDGFGRQLGIMPTWKAIEDAKSNGLDVMQVGFHDGIAICKMCNYGKFMYEQKQKAKEAKKKAKAAMQDLKEIDFTIRIDVGDLATKVRHVKEHLADNCKVKLVVKFSKREMCHIDLGKDVMKSVLNELDGIAELDSNPKLEGR